MRYVGFFATLYFVQGAALAYIVNFQKPFLAGEGVSKESLGLFTSLLLVPFILKVFLGMLTDRVPVGPLGSRKPYMAIGLGLFSACYFMLSFVNPGSDFFMFASITWIASLGLAMFDTCADGWAIDVTAEKEQNAVQAAMIAGKSFGLIAMSYAFGIISTSHGFGAVFRIIAGLSVLVLALVLMYPHRPLAKPEVLGSVRRWSDRLGFFYVCFALFGIVYSIASFGTDGLVTLHLSEARGAGREAIGNFGVARGLGALMGAGGHVLFSRRFGLKHAQVLSLVMLGMGILLPLFGLPLLLAGGLWGLAWGFQETAFVTLAMRYAEGAWSATFFAIAMIFSNIGTSIGEAIAAPLVPALGYAGVFFSLACLAWGCLIFVWKVPASFL